jgi:hypothetical protein
MYFDRYDILEAYYLYGSLWHSGQWSKEYAYMGRALKVGFTPSCMLSYEHMSENGREIYNSLVSKGS